MAAILLLCASSAPAQEKARPKPLLDRARKAVRFPATLRLKAFEASDPPGHHLITWKGGQAGKHALLQTPVSDRDVLDALEGLGLKPGDNLVEESWTQRADPHHPAPDLQAKGPKLAITVIVNQGQKEPLRLPVRALLEDLDRRGYDWRLAGNRKLIERWRSGCVVCLQSCPGSKIANAQATMRHLHLKRSRFRPSKRARELGEGTQVEVEVRLAPRKKPR